MDIARKSVSYTDRGNKVKSEQREIRKVIPRKRFFIQVSMYKSETPQCLSPQRKTLEFRDKYPLCIADDNMGYAPASVDKYANLAAYFCGYFRKISRQLRTDQFAVYLPPVDPLNRVKVTGLEPCQISVKCWYLYPPVVSPYYITIKCCIILSG